MLYVRERKRMMTELLQVENLKKYFKTSRGTLHAVDDVSFSIEKGRTLGVVGESGCGKSTLGRTILRLTPATSGKILFDGRDITTLSKREMHEQRKRMQLIFQDPFSSLNPRYCVKEQIADPIKTYRLYKSKAELDRRIEELMDTVGLAKRLLYAYPHELDGGRRQRIGIARALALEPQFIICDEPVSALDVSIQAQILNLLMDIQKEKGLAYMFVTHDMSVVKHVSDDIMVMYLGCMVEKSAAKELFKYQLHPYTKGLISSIPIPNIHIERKNNVMSGELTSPVDPKPGCRFAGRCPYATETCHEKDPVLEEVRPNHFVACHNVKAINVGLV